VGERREKKGGGGSVGWGGKGEEGERRGMGEGRVRRIGQVGGGGR